MNSLLLAAVILTNFVGNPLDRELAATAANHGGAFEQIFADLCRQALSHTNSYRVDDCARAVFGGLWQWASATGKPKFQGRHDLALHFISGGVFEGYLDLGERMAARKERQDARQPGNRYDLDDYAATMLGVRWMQIATTGPPEQTRQWLELWADGKLTLTDSIPKLQFGQLPAFETADAERRQQVRDFVNATLQLPPEPAPAAPPRR